MKTDNMLIKQILFVVLFTGIFACASVADDYDTPESTINKYYNSYNDNKVRSECFYPPGFEGKPGKYWRKYTISQKRETERAGKETYSGIRISSEAVEIIVEETTNESTILHFWYLLQSINGKWKIIEYSHLPSKDFPAFD